MRQRIGMRVLRTARRATAAIGMACSILSLEALVKTADAQRECATCWGKSAQCDAKSVLIYVGFLDRRDFSLVDYCYSVPGYPIPDTTCEDYDANHADCIMLAGLRIEETIEAVGRGEFAALARQLAEDGRWRLNVKRGALQAVGCQGAIVAHVPLKPAQLAQLHGAVRERSLAAVTNLRARLPGSHADVRQASMQ